MSFKELKLFFEKPRFEIIAVFFTVYGIYLRLACLWRREFQTDELWSLQFMLGVFKPFWQRIYYTDTTYFPGEYILNWPFVFFFKANKWGIAIPHILFTFLGFYFLYLICKRYFSSIFAWIAVFALVAFHRELIYHSFELRPYAVLPTLALGAFYFLGDLVSRRYSLSLAQKVLIGSFFIFTIMYHSYGIIILFLTFTYFMLCESGKRTFREIAKHNYRFISVVLLIGLPLYLWYSLGNPFLVKGIGYNVFEFIPNPLVNFFGFIKVVLCCLTGNKSLYLLAIFLIFPFLFSYPKRLQQIGFLLVLVMLPVMLIVYIDMRVSYWFIQRQFIWVMPFFALLIGFCIDSFIEFIQEKKRNITYGK